MPVVLIGGTPVEMGEWIDQAKAVVWGWYAGMEGGTAMAEVLLGEVNPSGKLPESFYKTITDCSAHSLGEFPGFEKVSLKAGQEKQVTVKVAADNGFSCKFFVGSSSRDLRLMD